jgi:hypothetical protein
MLNFLNKIKTRHFCIRHFFILLLPPHISSPNTLLGWVGLGWVGLSTLVLVLLRLGF